MGRGGSPSGPKPQAQTRRLPPNPNPPAEAPGRGGVYFGNTRDSATLLCRSSLSHPANIEYVGLTSFPEQKVMAALLCLGAGLGPRQHRI